MGHIFISQMRQVTLREKSDRDMRHCHFLKSICDIGDPTSSAPHDEIGGIRSKVRDMDMYIYFILPDLYTRLSGATLPISSDELI